MLANISTQKPPNDRELRYSNKSGIFASALDSIPIEFSDHDSFLSDPMKPVFMHAAVGGSYLYFLLALSLPLLGLGGQLPGTDFERLERDVLVSAACFVFLTGALTLRILALSRKWNLGAWAPNLVQAMSLALVIFMAARGHTVATILVLFAISMQLRGEPQCGKP